MDGKIVGDGNRRGSNQFRVLLHPGSGLRVSDSTYVCVLQTKKRNETKTKSSGWWWSWAAVSKWWVCVTKKYVCLWCVCDGRARVLHGCFFSCHHQRRTYGSRRRCSPGRSEWSAPCRAAPRGRLSRLWECFQFFSEFLGVCYRFGFGNSNYVVDHWIDCRGGRGRVGLGMCTCVCPCVVELARFADALCCVLAR